MDLNWNDITGQEKDYAVAADPGQGAVTMSDGDRQVRIFAPMESLGDCVWILDRMLNGENLIDLDLYDLGLWDGWQIVCRQSVLIPPERLDPLPAQQIGPEWGQVQTLLLHFAVPEEADFLTLIDELCAQFMEAASKDANVMFSAEFSSNDFLRLEVLGLTKD